jgi:hypothetical protein
MNKLRTYEGGCHCERVRFRVTADLDTVILCNCSICTKKGIIHLIVPPERFELLCGKDDLMTYTFNTGVAKHTFRKHSGIHPFYVPRSDPDKIDVNARCIDDIDLTALSRKILTEGTGSDSMQQLMPTNIRFWGKADMLNPEVRR